MELQEMIMVIENDKGTERNYLMDVLEYLSHICEKNTHAVSETIDHIVEVKQTKENSDKWAEVYLAANKTISARFCWDGRQLCKFLAGEFNDSEQEHYFCTEACSKKCLQLLDRLGVEPDGTYRQEEKEYKLEIRELLCRKEVVRAKSLDEAIDKLEALYKQGKIVLDAEDFRGVTFEQEKKETR